MIRFYIVKNKTKNDTESDEPDWLREKRKSGELGYWKMSTSPNHKESLILSDCIIPEGSDCKEITELKAQETEDKWHPEKEESDEVVGTIIHKPCKILDFKKNYNKVLKKRIEKLNG